MSDTQLKYQVGDKVNYHSIIGGPVTSTDHEVRALDLAPNNFDCDVAWITNKRGCVAVRALSHAGSEVTP